MYMYVRYHNYNYIYVTFLGAIQPNTRVCTPMVKT